MSASDDVVELSLRYSECIARALRAEAEIARLRAALDGARELVPFALDVPSRYAQAVAWMKANPELTTSASTKEGT